MKPAITAESTINHKSASFSHVYKQEYKLK